MSDMTMTAAPSSFRVGAVFGRSFELLFRDFGKFFGLSLIAWAPFLLLTLVAGGAQPGLAAGVPPDGGAIAQYVLSVFGIGLLWMLLSVLCQAIILYGAFEQMRGKSFAVGESLKRGLARFFPILGVILCMAFGAGFASILFFVPGIIVYLMWLVAVPVCIVEERGPMASLGRSRELTRGSRWKLFGIVMVIAVASWLVQMIVQFVFLAAAGKLLAALATFLCSALIAAYRSILGAVVYHDLRVAREGVDIDRIAAVFD
jgi:hypothetical protein